MKIIWGLAFGLCVTALPATRELKVRLGDRGYHIVENETTIEMTGEFPRETFSRRGCRHLKSMDFVWQQFDEMQQAIRIADRPHANLPLLTYTYKGKEQQVITDSLMGEFLLHLPARVSTVFSSMRSKCKKS